MEDVNPYASPGTTAKPVIHSDPVRALTEQQAKWLRRALVAMWLLLVTISVFTLMQATGATMMALRERDSFFIRRADVVWRSYMTFQVSQAIGGAILAIALWRHARSIGHVLRFDAATAAVNRAIRTGCQFWIVAAIFTLTMILLAIVVAVVDTISAR